jgi:acyl-CoA synthetase (AMP-forming)/AMP-acid ligase II
MAQVESLMVIIEPTRADVLVSWLPLYHDMGLIGCLLGAAGYPGPLVLIPPEHFLARPALWLRAVGRHRGTISAAPHFAYAYAAERVRDGDLDGLSLRSWRIALDGAEPVTVGALQRFAARFAGSGLDPGALMPVYGLSEASLAVTFSPPGRPPLAEGLDPARLAAGEVIPGRRQVVSVGRPVPGVEVEVRDDEGTPLPERRLGRIHVRGPSVMQGYFGDEEATGRALRGGWLDTGDLGFHASGELFVHGRAKDLVIVRGANHAPEEFESALAGISGLRPGCAVALGFVPPEGDGEELLVLAERVRGAREPGPALETEIRAAVLSHTGVKAHTVRLLEPGTLPRTSSGKMRRAEALRRFLDGTLLPPRKVNVLSLAREVARSGIASARSRR